LKIFNKLGLSRKSIPAFEKSCNESYLLAGNKPQILSPHQGVKYTYRFSKKDNQIAFNAKVDSDSKKVHWYLDEQYLGARSTEENLLWDASPGRYTVRVVDELGRESSRELEVVSFQ